MDLVSNLKNKITDTAASVKTDFSLFSTDGLKTVYNTANNIKDASSQVIDDAMDFFDFNVIQKVHNHVIESDEALNSEKEELRFYSTLNINERLCLFVRNKYSDFIKSYFLNSKYLIDKINQGFKVKNFDIKEVGSNLNKSLEKVFEFNYDRCVDMKDASLQNYNYVLGNSKSYSIK